MEKEGKELESLQQENLRLLSEFVKCCEANNIWYCLAYGTMLGAVRHKGFIPWDLDVDVYVLLKDVGRIRSYFAEHKLMDAKYFARGITPRYTRSHEVIESTANEDAHLDIYPLIGAPSDPEEQKKFAKKTYYARKILKSKYVDIKKCLPKNRKFVRIAKCIDAFISDKRIEKIYQKLEHQYEFDNSEYTMSIVNYGKSTNCVKKEVLMETMECTFENLKCAIPKDYDTYLTQIYGDYMTPVKY